MTGFDFFCAVCLIAGLLLAILARTVWKEQLGQSSTSPLPSPAVPTQVEDRAGKPLVVNEQACVLPLGSADWITLHQAYEGLLITGGIGAGKTTGPGEELARNLLRAGAGFCVMTAKVDEFARWKKLCKQTGREGDLIRLAPGEKGPDGRQLGCDLLDYVLSQQDATVEAGAQLLDILIEVTQRQSGKSDEQFWAMFAQRIIRRAIATVWLAKGHCSISDVYRLIMSAPQTAEQAMNAEWREKSFCFHCLLAASLRHDIDNDYQLCMDFWLREWAELSDKTRSSGQAIATNVLDKFLTSPMAEMFSSGKTNLRPDSVEEGKIIVVDMPYLRWREPGQFAQIIFKTLVQRAVLRRDVDASPRPVCLWQDEAQVFVTSQDAMAQTMARQSRLVSVAITQNIPMLRAAMGGGDGKGKDETEAWIANHATKVVCANACKDTNEFFSELLGKGRHLFMSGNTRPDAYDPVKQMMGSGGLASGGFSEQWHPDVPPEEFTKLMKGGKEYGFVVEGYVFQNGRIFSNRKTWLRAEFPQKF